MPQAKQVVLNNTTLTPVDITNGIASFRNQEKALQLAETLTVSTTPYTKAGNSRAKITVRIPVQDESTKTVTMCRATIEVYYPKGHSNTVRDELKSLVIAALQDETVSAPLWKLDSVF